MLCVLLLLFLAGTLDAASTFLLASATKKGFMNEYTVNLDGDNVLNYRETETVFVERNSGFVPFGATLIFSVAVAVCFLVPKVPFKLRAVVAGMLVVGAFSGAINNMLVWLIVSYA